MNRRLVPLLALVLTLCSRSRTRKVALHPPPRRRAFWSGCLSRHGTSDDERPKNTNTASFSRGWYVSADCLLWASATGRFYVGENKVLWQRPGSVVAVTGKLLDGDASTARVPTITGPQGYEGLDYQASGVTFPAPGCWEVEARAQSSILDFVVHSYPR